LGIAYRPDGTIGARFQGPRENIGTWKRERVGKEFTKSPYTMKNQFERPPPGNYKAERLSLAPVAGRVWKFESTLAIDPYDGKTLSASAEWRLDEFAQAALNLNISSPRGLGFPFCFEGPGRRLVGQRHAESFLPAKQSLQKHTDTVFCTRKFYEALLTQRNPAVVATRTHFRASHQQTSVFHQYHFAPMISSEGKFSDTHSG